MIVDNFDKFPRERKTGEFYFVQIIERAKDNPEKKWLNGWNSARVLKSYSIGSQAELDKRIPIIKEYCEKYNARCYMHPARRSQSSIAQQMVIMLWEYMLHSRHRLERIYESACWTNTWVERLWIIDIDTKDMEEVNRIRRKIVERFFDNKEWRHFYLPTLNWYHIITTSFNPQILEWEWLDIHKNNPTLLYCNINN